MGRPGQPVELAPVYVLLASDQAAILQERYMELQEAKESLNQKNRLKAVFMLVAHRGIEPLLHG